MWPKRRSEGAERGGCCQYNIGELFKWSESAGVVLCFAVMAGSGLEFCAICAFVCIQEYQKCGVNVNVLVNCMYSSTVEGKRVRAEEAGRKSHDRMVAGEIGGMWDRWDSLSLRAFLLSF